MRTKHKNELFKHLTHENFSPRDFSFEEAYSEEGSHIWNKIIFLEDNAPSKFDFILRQKKDDFNLFDCSYVAYAPVMNRSSYGNSYNDIEQICDTLDFWIKNHITAYLEDKAEPDLWEEYLKFEQNSTRERIDLEDTGNFTLDEKQQILLGLQALAIEIKSGFQLDNDQLKLVNDGIKYLSDGVDRLNKVDWRGILIGQFFTIATAIGTTHPQAFAQLYDMFMKVIQVVHFLPAP